jgi:iron-sulfur cluster assembly accessory protein
MIVTAMSAPTPPTAAAALLWTSDAVAAIRALRVEEDRPDAAFRVDLRLGGCQGFKVYFELDGVNPDDVVFEAAPDVRIAVQEEGLPLIAGGVLDYESSHRGRGFRLANPAAASACGCGQAFYADFSEHEPAAPAATSD